jgi:hypothetical protein
VATVAGSGTVEGERRHGRPRNGFFIRAVGRTRLSLVVLLSAIGSELVVASLIGISSGSMHRRVSVWL